MDESLRYRLMALSIFALAFIFSYVLLNTTIIKGINWDFMDLYLSSQSLLKGNFYNTIVNYGTVGNLSLSPEALAMLNKTPGFNPSLLSITGAADKISLIETTQIYFGSERYPLAIFMMSFLSLFNSQLTIPMYLQTLVVLLALSSLYVSRRMGLNPLILLSFIFSTYTVQYTMLFNSTEALSMAMLLLFIGGVYSDTEGAGLALGFAGLAKYTNLIFLPLLLFLTGRKKQARALVLFALITSTWLLFNFLLFGNPLHSYLADLFETAGNHVNLALDSFQTPFGTLPYPFSYFAVLIYPLSATLITLIIIFLKKPKTRSKRSLFEKIKVNRAYYVLSAFLLLAIVGFVSTLGHVDGPVRIEYAIYGALSILAPLLMMDRRVGDIMFRIGKQEIFVSRVLPFVLFLVSVAWLLVYLNFVRTNPYWMQYASNGTVFKAAVSALGSHGLLGCSIVTNAWPYMRYYNVPAYTSYYYEQLYYNPVLKRAPVLIFNGGGTPPSQVLLKNITQSFSYSNFSIYLPNNYVCFT